MTGVPERTTTSAPPTAGGPSDTLVAGPPVHGDAAQAPASLALGDVASHVRFWIVVALGLALDLGTKYWAFGTMRQGGRRVLIPHVLEFHTTMNPGALFGIGKGHTEVFVIASLLALVLVIWMFAQTPRRRWLTQIALGAILAGALGNMYDRVFVQLVAFPVRVDGAAEWRYFERTDHGDGATLLREYPVDEQTPEMLVPTKEVREDVVGYVRDFIKIPTKWLGGRDLWPWIFNVADMLLVGGVGVLAIRLLREPREPREVAGPQGPVGEAE